MQDVLERKPEIRPEDDESHGLISKAIIGAAAGAVGTWALDRADWAMWRHENEDARRRTRSVRPFGEPPAHVLVRKVERSLGLTPTPEQHDFAGLLTHYAIGVGPAIAYAMVRDKLPVQGPVRGLLYGLTLFLLQDEGLNAVTGLGARPRDYPWQAHARGLVSHLVYGVVTELALDFIEQSVQSREGA